MRSEVRCAKLFADIPEALANTVEIAKRCNVTVRLGEYFLPQFPTGDMSTEDYRSSVQKKAGRGVWPFYSPDEEERLKRRPEYDERLETELPGYQPDGLPGLLPLSLWNLSSGRKLTAYR